LYATQTDKDDFIFSHFEIKSSVKMNEAKTAVPSTTLCSTQLPQPPSSPTNTCGWEGNGRNEERSRERSNEKVGMK